MNIDYRLYLVTDRYLSLGRPIKEIINEAISGGITIIQLREKKLNTIDFYKESLQMIKFIKEKKEIPVIINDRIDIAQAVNADGVHLGKNDLPLDAARNILGKKKIIGISVSNASEAVFAEKTGASYVAVSPVFTTMSKVDTDPPVGLDGIGLIREAVKIPVIAIGGINKSNAYDVIKAGADGIAVISAITSAGDPKKSCEELIYLINNALKERRNK